MTRLTIQKLHDRIGITVNTAGYGRSFGAKSKAALSALLSNSHAPALTEDDYAEAAKRLNVPIGHMKGSKKIEAPRGAFDDHGRPTLLYERHVFARNTDPKGCFNDDHPSLSASVGYGKGGYGAFSGQFDRLAAACALDPEAAFRACSWGAFQVLGENAEYIGYTSAFEMVISLTTGEAAHLESYVKFIEKKGLQDELRACKPGDPNSCIPFVRAYNGEDFRAFNYHVKFAGAI
jgi:hypothetical protein